MSSIKWSAVAVLVLLLLTGGLSWAALHYHTKAATAEQGKQQAESERNAAQAIAGNVITTMNLFNSISKGAEDEKQQSDTDSAARVIVIRDATKNDTCAGQPVPAAAVDQLRAHRDKIRSGSSGTHSGQSVN